MSYDIYIKAADGDAAHTPDGEPHQITGGTYAVGGTDELWLNITYNYSGFFRRYIDEADGIRWLYGKRVSDTLQTLRAAFDSMHGEPSDDYWEASEGNAKKAIGNLIRLGELCPDGIWDGD